MTNDKARRSNKIFNANLVIWNFIRHSSFWFRHFKYMVFKKNFAKKKLSDEEQTKEQETPALPIFGETQRERGAKRLMWLGVISFSAIIFALWGWSLAVQISGLQWNKAPETNLANKTKEEWNEIFAKQKEDQAGREATLQKIRDALKGLSAIDATSTNQMASSTITTTKK